MTDVACAVILSGAKDLYNTIACDETQSVDDIACQAEGDREVVEGFPRQNEGVSIAHTLALCRKI